MADDVHHPRAPVVGERRQRRPRHAPDLAHRERAIVEHPPEHAAPTGERAGEPRPDPLEAAADLARQGQPDPHRAEAQHGPRRQRVDVAGHHQVRADVGGRQLVVGQHRAAGHQHLARAVARGAAVADQAEAGRRGRARDPHHRGAATRTDQQLLQDHAPRCHGAAASRTRPRLHRAPASGPIAAMPISARDPRALPSPASSARGSRRRSTRRARTRGSARARTSAPTGAPRPRRESPRTRVGVGGLRWLASGGPRAQGLRTSGHRWCAPETCASPAGAPGR